MASDRGMCYDKSRVSIQEYDMYVLRTCDSRLQLLAIGRSNKLGSI